MMRLDKLRVWISKNLAPLIFLSAYFVTVVLGNILYALPFGREQLEKNRYTADILQFETLFSSGYWLLLFLPFIVTPVVIVFVRILAGKYLERWARVFPEFTKSEYLIIVTVSYLFVLYAMFKADAFSLFLAGTDPVASVEARFKIRNQLGFIPLVVLMSILHYLSIYSLVRWIMDSSRFWVVATIVNAILMSVFLVLLNMKWPILIFYAGLVLAVFVYSKRYPYLKAVIGGVLLITMYFMISAFVFRLLPAAQAPDESMPHITEIPAVNQVPQIGLTPQVQLEIPKVSGEVKGATGVGVIDKTLIVGQAAASNAPMLLFNVVNRMAIIYPYYYQVFTKEGQVCGGIIAQARIGPACRPSTFIYSRIFNDSFNGRGTAPAAVHISGYALGGWPIAIFALLCASVVLGLFATLPLNAGAVIGSLAITGAIVGYHFSQIPGEGPIFYDHGVFWVILGLVVFKGWRSLGRRFGSGNQSLDIK
jgi:hypothetical protein